MNKFTVVIMCIAAGWYSLAGTRINGPVGVLDAEGEVTYEYIEIYDIVGAVDCVEVIGYKSEGLYEFRRYLNSADPKCIVASTNVPARTYENLSSGKYRLSNRLGLNMSLVAQSEKKRVLVVGIDDESPAPINQTGDVDATDWQAKSLIDNESLLSYRNSCCSSFIGDNTDLLFVSLYSNEAGVVKIWYEVADESNKIKTKGWFSGKIKDDSIMDKKEHIVFGAEGFHVCVASNTIPSPSTGRKSTTWLSFGVQDRDGEKKSAMATLYL